MLRQRKSDCCVGQDPAGGAGAFGVLRHTSLGGFADVLGLSSDVLVSCELGGALQFSGSVGGLADVLGLASDVFGAEAILASQDVAYPMKLHHLAKVKSSWQ